MATTEQKIWVIIDNRTLLQIHTMIGGEKDQVHENAARLLGRKPEEIIVRWTGEYRTVCCGG